MPPLSSYPVRAPSTLPTANGSTPCLTASRRRNRGLARRRQQTPSRTDRDRRAAHRPRPRQAHRPQPTLRPEGPQGPPGPRHDHPTPTARPPLIIVIEGSRTQKGPAHARGRRQALGDQDLDDPQRRQSPGDHPQHLAAARPRIDAAEADSPSPPPRRRPPSIVSWTSPGGDARPPAGPGPPRPRQPPAPRVPDAPGMTAQASLEAKRHALGIGSLPDPRRARARHRGRPGREAPARPGRPET